MTVDSRIIPGTVVWIAPFYNRSGYGIGARSVVLALHKAGVRVKTISVNEIEPGVDDCDLALLKSLEAAPVISPITAVISHVPSDFWVNMQIPEPHLRIMNTTFDSSAQGNAPPPAWIEVCRKMDQVWLATERERNSFVSAGLPFRKTQVVHWPHPWVDNPGLPAVTIDPPGEGKPFRFLSIAMFLPRRRWDTLIEAYLEEYKDCADVELYLKVNYPSWHPTPGKPRRDLHAMIDFLRKKTGSSAPITIDEDLGTRMGVVRLMDSANVYISTDTAPTGPISEAFARRRLTIMPSSLKIIPESGYVAIAEDPEAKRVMTPEMLLYQPHHGEASMPCLKVCDVRDALRRAYSMSPEGRKNTVTEAALCNTTPSESVSMILKAVERGWKYKRERVNSAREARPTPKRIVWEGSQLAGDTLSVVSSELCLRLIDSGYELSILPGKGVENLGPVSDPRFEKIAPRIRKPLSGEADVHVRHLFPPSFESPPKGHWITMDAWGYGRLPLNWVEPVSNLVDEIWVPGRHVQKSFISSGVPSDCVQVIPYGVDPARFNPSARRFPVDSRKNFKFLFVGAAVWEEGFDILLSAYRRSFNAGDDVALVVKEAPSNGYSLNDGAKKIIEEMRKDPGAPEIVHIEAALAPSEMPGLYTACNCLVLPYRAMGFPLPVLEAMACGRPVITTEGGAADDFCPPGEAFLLSSERVDFKPNEVRLAGGAGWMLKPDQEALCGLMREAFENDAAARKRAVAFSVNIREQYDWDVIVETIRKRIDVVTQKPVKRESFPAGLRLGGEGGVPCR